MSIATSSPSSSLSPAIDRHVPSPVVVNELDAGVGPWPSMSYRAGVIARVLALIALSALLVATDASPLWTALLLSLSIGTELTIASRRRAARQARLLAWRPSGVRYSQPCVSMR